MYVAIIGGRSKNGGGRRFTMVWLLVFGGSGFSVGTIRMV